MFCSVNQVNGQLNKFLKKIEKKATDKLDEVIDEKLNGNNSKSEVVIILEKMESLYSTKDWNNLQITVKE